VDVLAFVLGELPSPPARVLEVGCGQGELARALAEAGHDVLAIDPDAPDGALFRQITLEELDENERFDAVVSSRALHHLPDLVAALDKVASLLQGGGPLVIDDFGWQRLGSTAASNVGIPPGEWRAEHHDLHTSDAMLRELGKRFIERSLTWEPYLYRESRQVVSEDVERELIAAGQLLPLGFRYVGVLR
jgi:SAM-dependent methyltransferase